MYFTCCSFWCSSSDIVPFLCLDIILMLANLASFKCCCKQIILYCFFLYAIYQDLADQMFLHFTCKYWFWYLLSNGTQSSWNNARAYWFTSPEAIILMNRNSRYGLPLFYDHFLMTRHCDVHSHRRVSVMLLEQIPIDFTGASLGCLPVDVILYIWFWIERLLGMSQSL